MSTDVSAAAPSATAESALPRILVVDDHPDIRDPLASFLKARGFAVGTAADGTGLRERLAQAPYDLVLLDVTMPGEDGFSLCRQLREREGPPVILLTSASATAQRVRGLESGADDYITKPFEPSELLARVRAVLRRAMRYRPPGQAVRLRFDDWTFDPLQHELVHADGRAVSLSAGETRLLKAFLDAPQQVLSRERLLDLCADADVFDRSIDSQISRLRRKVEANPRQPRLLKTAWGNGYLFSASVQACA